MTVLPGEIHGCIDLVCLSSFFVFHVPTDDLDDLLRRRRLGLLCLGELGGGMQVL